MVVAPSRSREAARFQAAVERLSRAGLDGRELVRRLAYQLRLAVPSGGLLLLRTDPTTVLPTDGVVEALPPALCKPFWDNELLEEDLNKFVALARSEIPAATLKAATGGDLSRSRRYRTLYQALGVTDELRVSFTARDGSCWGIAQLARTQGATFSDRERDLLAAAAPSVAAALRVAFTAARSARSAHSPHSAQPAQPARAAQAGPALVILDKAGEIGSITPQARDWLADLVDGSGTGMAPVPEPVYTVAGRARAARARPAAGGGQAGPGYAGSGQAGSEHGLACAQVRSATHGWLHLHASCLDGPDGADSPDGAVAVVITPAHAPDLVPLLALGYRLTHREQEVLQFLARGMTTVELTQHLGISPHTVRDHIKALFGKVGVRSRAELVAKIFAEHYFDQLEADVDRLDPV